MNDHACCAPSGDEPPIDADPAVFPAADPGAGARAREGAVALPGACFDMGSEDPDVNPGDSESPIRTVHVEPFGMMPTTVTNQEFAVFVDRTGYRTTAEKLGWSYVFSGLVEGAAGPHVRGRASGTPWWLGVDGADWRHPEGAGSTIAERLDHPVVHVSHDDALAYCSWVDGRLPTETEWEYAARGGLRRARYPWGDELTPNGEHRCNIWQGRFPDLNTAVDGWKGTCPVNEYPPNGYGLYNMAGNVWEWSADLWNSEESEVLYVMRGGSYICHDSYCNRYRVSARTGNFADSSSGHLGFRVVVDAVRSPLA
ncbi:formylglycine-generating enzyme family protein [Streptomyces tubercidicus]|uniref:formylglycine-generating enzyme family protein n=1 Tax=Streptomyces tubercidicus TaxID=47759 RepID=UPI0036C65209